MTGKDRKKTKIRMYEEHQACLCFWLGILIGIQLIVSNFACLCGSQDIHIHTTIFVEQFAVQDEILLYYSYMYFLRNHTPVMDFFYVENMQNVDLGRHNFSIFFSCSKAQNFATKIWYLFLLKPCIYREEHPVMLSEITAVISD